MDTATALVNVPVARGLLPPGSKQQDCITYSRVRKSTLIALRLFGDGVNPADHTVDELNTLMDAAAENVGVHIPHSGDTRLLVFDLLTSYRAVGTEQSATDTGTPTGFTYWRISYRDLGRSQQTAPLVTADAVLRRHRYLERRSDVDGIEIRETTVVESTRTVTIADLT